MKMPTWLLGALELSFRSIGRMEEIVKRQKIMRTKLRNFLEFGSNFGKLLVSLLRRFYKISHLISVIEFWLEN